MKHLFTGLFLMLSVAVFAQSPNAFNYQGVARDNGGNTLANQAVGLRISIVSGSPTGTVEYVETHAVGTNAFGLFNVAIGTGSVTSGSFAGIDWSADEHYTKVEFDPAGGSSYSNLGTSQLLSVPYAMYSNSSSDGIPAGADGQTLRYNGAAGEATSSLYNDGTNIGIGTTTPMEKLDVNGDVAVSGSSRSVLAPGGAFNISSASGIDVIIDNDDNSTNSSFKVKRNGDGSETIFEAKETGDVVVVGDYTYASSKTYYKSYAANAFKSIKPDVYSFGQSTGATSNDHYGVFESTTTTALGYANAPIQLPDGAVITELKAWVWDNDASSLARVGIYSLLLGGSSSVQVGLSVESDSPTILPNVQELTIGINIFNSTIDNSIKAYYLKFTGHVAVSEIRLYGVRIAYTVDQAD